MQNTRDFQDRTQIMSYGQSTGRRHPARPACAIDLTSLAGLGRRTGFANMSSSQDAPSSASHVQLAKTHDVAGFIQSLIPADAASADLENAV